VVVAQGVQLLALALRALQILAVVGALDMPPADFKRLVLVVLG
jgi:hypothetical protein